ncbi:pirin family protein [Mucilaginibacter sp. RB4R14]|nr:pirin family protein [Mucilaginibacter aurantiaciroseus]MCO5936751.1 pirin family protein [Mucilaginibacter aurantiaciroseus]
MESALEHQDSMGNKGIIKAGDVQIMSAGAGVFHSEYNLSRSKDTQSLQIWMFPKVRGIKPRYDQKKLKQYVYNE